MTATRLSHFADEEECTGQCEINKTSGEWRRETFVIITIWYLEKTFDFCFWLSRLSGRAKQARAAIRSSSS